MDQALAISPSATTMVDIDPAWRLKTNDVTNDALNLLDREWLLTNGAGSFAMGTLPGVNTRRYHGLLVAATHPPIGRIVALNQVLEELAVQWEDGEHLAAFSTCLFQQDGKQVQNPTGYQLLRQFQRGLTVRWVMQWRMVQLHRELVLHWKQPAVTLRYAMRWQPRQERSQSLPKSVTLRLHPMITMRDFHSLLRRDDAGDVQVDPQDDAVTIRRAGQSMTLQCPEAAWLPTDQWWYNLYYPADAERGQGAHEDAYVPGRFDVTVEPGQDIDIALTAALGDEPVEPDLDASARATHLAPIVDHLSEGCSEADKGSSLPRLFAIASDDFVVDRTIKGEQLSTILAGYPWFADWGRDTFIALPGLLLETGRYEEAKATLRAFADAIHNGLVPNRFDDYDESAAHYNTVDASLWFIQAALRYVETAQDAVAWDQWLGDACASIVDAYIAGTDNDIRMAGDGLITAGNPDTQLTWMDAACGGPPGSKDRVVFTPRHGKAVEINALWYAALMGLADRFETSRADVSRHYAKIASRMKRSFPKVFWNDAVEGCFDHVWTDDDGEDHIDASIRPNQIFVASLPYSPLPRTRQTKIVELVRDRLLTPMGLRTLPEDDPNYHAKYTGPQFDRDEAYHQGTVWGWLIGPYAEAVMRVGKFSRGAKDEARAAIDPLLERMQNEGLGQLHEIFEADPPHRPVGCIAQAWSIAEVLRVWRMAR